MLSSPTFPLSSCFKPEIVLALPAHFLSTMAMSVDAKLLKQTKFPLEFNRKVDMKKVNVEVMKKFVFPRSFDSMDRLTSLLL